MMFIIVATKKKPKDAWLMLKTWEKIVDGGWAGFDGGAVSH